MKKLSVITILAVLVASPFAFAQVGDFAFEASTGSDQGAGAASFSGDEYTIEASGDDIWGSSDGMYWIYNEISGAGWRATIEMDFGPNIIPEDGGEAESSWKKAGFMFRADESDGSIAISGVIRSDNGARIQVRPEAGAGTRGTGVVGREDTDTQVFQFLRIGQTFVLLRQQTDGSFRNVATDTVPEAPEAGFLGLALTSHDTSRIESATFKNFSLEQISAAANATRIVTGAAVSKPGDVAQVQLDVTGLAGAGDTTVITETVPDGWTISNVNASVGTATADGGTITWTIEGSLDVEPQLLYDVTIGSNNGSQSFSGSASAGGNDFSTGGDSGLFVGVKSADLGLFDDSMDITNDADNNLGEAGVAFYDDVNGVYTVVGSGNDIWDSDDSFHYLYKAVPIDQKVELKATVELDPFTSGSDWAKAGPMIRDDLESNSPHVFSMIRSNGRDWAPQWRDTWGAGGAWDGDPSLIFGGTEEGQQNGTVAISRDPATDTVTFSYWDAATGEKVDSLVREATTEFLGSFDDDSIYFIGFAVTAHETGSISIGRFSQVELTIGDQTSDVGAWSLY